MSTFAIVDPVSELSHGDQSPTSLYQTLQTLHLHQSAQTGPPPAPAAAAAAAATASTAFPQFCAAADASAFRPDDPDLNGPYPPAAVDVVGTASYPLDAAAALQMAAGGEDLLTTSPPYVCAAVPLIHPNLQMIREDVAGAGAVSAEPGGVRAPDPPALRPTVSPPHPVISITDALGRVMPVVMVTQGDAPAPAADAAVPMDESALVDFPAGYFAAAGNYPPSAEGPLDLSTSQCNDRSGLRGSTVIRTGRPACELYRDVSRALESSSAKELVRSCDVHAGLFCLASAAVSLQVRVCDGSPLDGADTVLPPGAALCFCHLAGDAALYESICCELVSRLAL